MDGDEPELTVENLEAAGFDEQFEAIESAVENHLEGKVANIAVVSEPFAGREIFLDYAEQEFGAATSRITFEEMVSDGLPELPNAEIVLVDNCQYLYQRQIGGFDMLEAFLDDIATRDSLYVTSWNRYAWTYLSAVSDVDSAFPETVHIPRLNPTQIGDLLQSYHGTPLPNFKREQNTGRVRTIDFTTETVPIAGRSVSIPRPVFNGEYILSEIRTDADIQPEAVVYQRIARLSEGDPGVATILWNQSIEDETIAVSDFKKVDKSLDIDRDEAFVLEVVLTNESIAYEQLRRICSDIAVDQALQTLITQGVVSIDDNDRISIEPTRLYPTVEHLTKRQLVW